MDPKQLSFYQERLLDYYKNPRFRGKLPKPDFSTAIYNPSCGDAVVFEGTIQNSKLKAVAFEGSGCVISLATASLLAEQVLGKSIDEVLNLETNYMRKLVAIEVGPTRLRCVLLSLEALQKGVQEYKAKEAICSIAQK